uniref:Pectin acetylesterase n=1 Tax=Anthurium amnicola TaxID=1678845 RepID=A0A1D1Y6T5_9ARAE
MMQCFFPQYAARDIRTPLFILNAAYDSWQIRNVMVPPGSDPYGGWKECRADIRQCTTKQLQALHKFRMQFLTALGRPEKNPSRGLFINSCFAHCQTEQMATWQFANSPTLGNSTIAEAVGTWFYDRNTFKKIDRPYPSNSSCHNNVYNPHEYSEEQQL